MREDYKLPAKCLTLFGPLGISTIAAMTICVSCGNVRVKDSDYLHFEDYLRNLNDDDC